MPHHPVLKRSRDVATEIYDYRVERVELRGLRARTRHERPAQERFADFGQYERVQEIVLDGLDPAPQQEIRGTTSCATDGRF